MTAEKKKNSDQKKIADKRESKKAKLDKHEQTSKIEEADKKETKKEKSDKKEQTGSKKEKVDKKEQTSKKEKSDKKEQTSKKEKSDIKEQTSKKERKVSFILEEDNTEIKKNDTKLEDKEKNNTVGRKRKEEDQTNTYTKKHKTENNFYIKNTLIVSNLSYKETEESIKECFEKYGSIEKVQLSYTKDQKFIGKAIVTFKKDIRIDEEVMLNHKILRIERMKNKIVNDKRIFISRINKNMTILQIRNILKEHGVKPKDIRTRFEAETKRNNGYCHLTYTSSEEAKAFEKKWNAFKSQLGPDTFFEYAQEKVEKLKKHKIK